MDLQQERVGVVLVSEREPIAILASPDYKTRRGVLRQVVDPVSNGCIRFRFPRRGTDFRNGLLAPLIRRPRDG